MDFKKMVILRHFFLKKANISATSEISIIPSTDFSFSQNFSFLAQKNVGAVSKNVILRYLTFSEKTTKVGQKIPKIGQNQI